MLTLRDLRRLIFLAHLNEQERVNLPATFAQQLSITQYLESSNETSVHLLIVQNEQDSYLVNLLCAPLR